MHDHVIIRNSLIRYTKIKFERIIPVVKLQSDITIEENHIGQNEINNNIKESKWDENQWLTNAGRKRHWRIYKQIKRGAEVSRKSGNLLMEVCFSKPRISPNLVF